ncbi:MAG: Trk system potassium transporter TrkA [Prevotellaceae bacterium]|nr:Trk system potassium transporter TrkA [Prevotellaceae bacterium]
MIKKVIIAGADAVGSHLAQLLARDNLDIVVIDEDQEKTDALTDSGNNDLMVINSSPSSVSCLKEAGVGRASLFIAVTPSESKNITCCMLAHALGAQTTVAQVDNAEYVQPQHEELFERMGINSLIYPEMLASQEIIEGLQHSWVRQYWEVHGGALVMLGIKLREEARLLDVPLYKLCRPDSPFHIVALKRDEQTIIPGGGDCLRLGDIAYFMTTKKHIPLIRQLVGKEKYADVSDVMVMGGGKTAVHLAHSKPGWLNMRIIEKSKERCRRLNEILENDDVIIICGDGSDSVTMQDEGIGECQAFAALSEQTERNILACLVAKRLGVRKTVAMVNETDYLSLAEKLDIGTIINKKAIAASHIYKMMLDARVADVKCLSLANADVAEFEAAEGCPAVKHLVKDLGLPKGVALGGLVRDGEGVSINGNTQIMPGDRVVVFTTGNLIKRMDRLFRGHSFGVTDKLINKFA